MIDQLIIGNKASHDDFDATVKEREIGAPPKKVIKETVPFSNVTYDFSAINGEVYWDERTLKYIFEIIAPNAEDLEDKKAAFSGWIMNVMQEPLHDPHIPDWRFIATFDDIDYDDDESLEKTSVTVTFSAYPYKIANSASVFSFSIPANSQKLVAVSNKSSHRITPTIESSTPVTVEMDGFTYGIPAGTVEDEDFKLDTDANVLTIINESGEDCIFNIKFYAEVF